MLSGYGFPAEFLPLVNVADVHLNFWDGNIFQAICNGVGIVRESAGIDDERIEIFLLKPIDNCTFRIALKKINFCGREFFAQTLQNAVHRNLAVNFWFAFSQKIKVRAVANEDFHRVKLAKTKFPSAKFNPLPLLKILI